MLSPSKVELTGIHYYDGSKDCGVIRGGGGGNGNNGDALRTISGSLEEGRRRTRTRKNNNKPALIIKRNIFGHKWVLKINEVADGNGSSSSSSSNSKKSRLLCVIYAFVFLAILTVFACGLYYSLFLTNTKIHSLFKKVNQNSSNTAEVENGDDVDTQHYYNHQQHLGFIKNLVNFWFNTNYTSPQQNFYINHLDEDDEEGGGGDDDDVNTNNNVKNNTIRIKGADYNATSSNKGGVKENAIRRNYSASIINNSSNKDQIKHHQYINRKPILTQYNAPNSSKTTIIAAAAATTNISNENHKNGIDSYPRSPKNNSNSINNTIVKNISPSSANTNPFVITARNKIVSIYRPSSPPHVCQTCKLPQEICMRTYDKPFPKCLQKVDGKDPTGCGGHCKLNTQFCKLLDKELQMYQCLNVNKLLLSSCTAAQWQCRNGMCVSAKRRCDGMLNCKDGSDETDCECNLDTHFQCGNKTSCIEKTKRCDGVVDCWDTADELLCSRGCLPQQISCANGQCIMQDKFCDGHYDCKDKSDEPKGCR